MIKKFLEKNQRLKESLEYLMVLIGLKDGFQRKVSRDIKSKTSALNETERKERLQKLQKDKKLKKKTLY